jgi:hypothetical protein
MSPPVVIDFLPSASAQVVEGKFIQIVLHDEEYLVFAARELDKYHNQILARFLAGRGLPFRWSGEQTLDVNVPGLAVVGGGRFRVDNAARTISLSDNSQVYGRFDDRDLAHQFAAAGHRWSGFALHIR